jgi:hypothetical protein
MVDEMNLSPIRDAKGVIQFFAVKAIPQLPDQ